MKYMADHKWDGLINIGDFMDFNCISSHNKENLRSVEGSRILKDYDHANAILDQHQRILRANNKKARYILLEGNHEYRMTRYIDALPQMEGMMEVDTNLHLEARGITWIPNWSKGTLFTKGNANFSHGLYTNQYHAAKMVNQFGVNVFYGHTHDVMSFPKSIKGTSKRIVGQSLGHLCQENLMGYMRGRPSNWQQAVTTFYFFPNGFFTYYVSLIFNHKFAAPDGTVYDGNDYVEPKKEKDAIWRSLR
jgi:hypothetical protein